MRLHPEEGLQRGTAGRGGAQRPSWWQKYGLSAGSQAALCRGLTTARQADEGLALHPLK